MEHTFIVTVKDCDRINALIVMQERIEYDEDYGFYYTIEWKEA